MQRGSGQTNFRWGILASPLFELWEGGARNAPISKQFVLQNQSELIFSIHLLQSQTKVSYRGLRFKKNHLRGAFFFIGAKWGFLLRLSTLHFLYFFNKLPFYRQCVRCEVLRVQVEPFIFHSKKKCQNKHNQRIGITPYPPFQLFSNSLSCWRIQGACR